MDEHTDIAPAMLPDEINKRTGAIELYRVAVLALAGIGAVGLVGILVISAGQFSLNFFPVLLLLNPADTFRILNIFGYEDVRRIYGLATVFPETLANPWLLGSALVCWIIAPLGVAAWRLK